MADRLTPLTGRCMCGAVQISTSAPFLGALYCHCKRCQRRSGTTRSITALCASGAARASLRSWRIGISP
jgi:hypothetical protein